MLTTILLGIVASLVAEFVTWLNKKLSGTVIQGQGAFLFSLVIAFAIAVIEVLIRHFNIDVSGFLALATSIFGVAQVWFYLIAKNLGLTVQASPDTSIPLS
jgi:branched-subunit amino acid transport protein